MVRRMHREKVTDKLKKKRLLFQCSRLCYFILCLQPKKQKKTVSGNAGHFQNKA